MGSFSRAFTMIELIFVIVILGILSAIAIPKFSKTVVEAQISKARADISSIRSAIVSERQSRLIKGDPSWINKLHNSTTYFDNNGTSANQLLMYGITPEDKDGHWHGATSVSGTDKWTYEYKLEGADNTFTYDPSYGTFKCTSGTHCDDLTK